MNRQSAFSALSALFLACMAASAGGAHADIVKCVDQAGNVTLTDVPCQYGAGTESAAAADARMVLPARAASRNVGETAWARSPALTRTFALDAATLRAARSSMVKMDEASHQQKLASLR